MSVQQLASAGLAAVASLSFSFASLELSIGNGAVRPVEALQGEELAAGEDLREPSAPELALDAQLRRRALLLAAGAEAACAPRWRREGQTAVQACTTANQIPQHVCMPKGAGMYENMEWGFPGLAAVDVTFERRRSPGIALRVPQEDLRR